MSEIFSISAYQTSAAHFFGSILQMRADLVLDIRLKNESQLCGFTKGSDLAYFVPLICHAEYVHDSRFAPDSELLSRYIRHTIDWEQYAKEYRQQMQTRGAVGFFREQYGRYARVCLIGTATKKRRSHSEVLTALLQDKNDPLTPKE